MAEPKVFVTASSGWAHLMKVLGTNVPQSIAQSQAARRGIRDLINRGR
jgi:hypothetical protein